MIRKLITSILKLDSPVGGGSSLRISRIFQPRIMEGENRVILASCFGRDW